MHSKSLHQIIWFCVSDFSPFYLLSIYSTYFSLPGYSVSPKFCSACFVFLTRFFLLLSVHPLIFSRKKRKRENTPSESCWVILCRRETACQRSNDSHSLLCECTLSVSLSLTTSFLPLHSLNLSLSHPFPHLLFRSFRICSQPWR